jgi:predicted RNA-binding protein Jag
MSVKESRKLIAEVLEKMNIQPVNVYFEHDPEIDMYVCSVYLDKNDSDLFHDNRKRVFRDFGHIIRLLFQTQGKDYSILFDLNGVDVKHIRHTKEQAQIAAERVVFFGKDYTFGPLNSYDRMITHSFLKQYPGVETVSEGEGSDRRLTVKKS